MPAFHETKIHGSRDFPYAVYKGILPKLFESFPLHWHDEMEIIYVTYGRINVFIERSEYVVDRNEIVFVPPQTIHSIKQHNDEYAVYFTFLFRFSLLEGSGDDICVSKYLEPIYSRRMKMPKYIDSESPLAEKVVPVLDSLIMCSPRFASDSELLIKAKIFEIMYYIKNNCTVADKDDENTGHLYDLLKESLLYLEDNYADHITVSEAAAMSNFSASYFSKLFRELTGSSFTQYLKNYRLERATEKIREGNARISDIAISCGFENLSYFTRAFRVKYGVTPKKYQSASASPKAVRS
ncbi:MAG: helix-turn-helix transcriptional regulator [Ruminococcus sp.]|nr:helix-turn-helix transcriptional regulator [Ruminococcus sp.]